MKKLPTAGSYRAKSTSLHSHKELQHYEQGTSHAWQALFIGDDCSEETDCMITPNYNWGHHMAASVALNAARLQYNKIDSILQAQVLST